MAELRVTDKAFVQTAPSSSIIGTEQLRPSDAEVVPLGLPQPADLSERRARRAEAVTTVVPSPQDKRCYTAAHMKSLGSMRNFLWATERISMH